MNKIEEINDKIDRLFKEREKILKDEEEKYITELKWIRECIATFEISPFDAMGIPKYKIFVSGKYPTPFRLIHVFGDSKLSENNINYGKDYGFDIDRFCFQTSNVETLFSFLRNFKFKQLCFDIKQYEVLDTIRKISMGL